MGGVAEIVVAWHVKNIAVKAVGDEFKVAGGQITAGNDQIDSLKRFRRPQAEILGNDFIGKQKNLGGFHERSGLS